MSMQQRIVQVFVIFGTIALSFQHFSPSSSSFFPLNRPTELHKNNRRHSMSSTDRHDPGRVYTMRRETNDEPEEEFSHVTDDVSPGIRFELQSGKETETPGFRAERNREKWGENGERLLSDSNINLGDKQKTNDREVRSWDENTMNVWGKRVPEAKRKWGENTMGVWGKRRNNRGENNRGENTKEKTAKEVVPTEHEPETTTTVANEKGSDVRHMSKRSVFDRVEYSKPANEWYDDYSGPSKRSRPYRNSVPIPYGTGPKRSKWETNTMKVWGKRSDLGWNDYSDDTEPVDVKRKWTSDKIMRVWGKRDPQLPFDDETIYNKLCNYYDN